MNTIKKLRQEKGLTQTQLADLMNIDQTTVSKWELGKATPDTPILIRLAAYFDVSTDYLLGLSQLFYPDKIKSEVPEEQELLNLFRKLPTDLRHRGLHYMKKLIELSQEENGMPFPQETSARPSNRRKA